MIFPNDAITKYDATPPNSAYQIEAGNSTLLYYSFRGAVCNNEPLIIKCDGAIIQTFYLTTTPIAYGCSSFTSFGIAIIPCPANLTFNNGSTKEVYFTAVYTPYSFASSTERFGFSNGEATISFLLFLSILGLFTAFILLHYLGFKIKRKPK